MPVEATFYGSLDNTSSGVIVFPESWNLYGGVPNNIVRHKQFKVESYTVLSPQKIDKIPSQD
jgi:hypothetical protein